MLGQWATEMNHVARSSAVQFQQKHIGQGLIFKPIAREKQARRSVPQQSALTPTGHQSGDPPALSQWACSSE
jgi:hypothetical protein